jgi:carboxylesterase type B
MTAPASQGLFHGVILNSAYFIQRYDTEADAKAVAQAAIAQVGCAAAADPDACIAAKSTHDLVTLEQDYFLSGVYTGPGCQTDHHRIFGPFIKAGGFLPRQPFEAFQLGLVSDVPMITGTVRGEGGTQTFGTLYPTPITTLADFKQVLATRFGPQNVDRLVALYPFPAPKIYVNGTDYRFALQDMFGGTGGSAGRPVISGRRRRPRASAP